MSVLGLSEKEYFYYVDNIREAFDLIGQEAYLYQVSSETKDIHRDPTTEYKDREKIGLVFEENPKPILKKFNWFTEDEELPYIAYVVALSSEGKPIEIRDNMVIEIESKLGLKSVRKFKVSNVVGNSIDPVVWICKLVPYRYKVDIVQETEKYDKNVREDVDSSGFNYLKTDL